MDVIRVPAVHILVDHGVAGDDDRWVAMVEALAPVAASLPQVVLQLRLKEMEARRRHGLVMRAVDRVADCTGSLCLNGRPADAHALGLAGCHVPERDVEDRGALRTPWVTAAAHDPAAVERAAAAGADAVVWSPVFDPGCKPGRGTGLRVLSDVASKAPVPVLALGGIRPDRVAACVHAGAYGIAVLTDVMGAADPTRRVRELAAAWEDASAATSASHRL